MRYNIKNQREIRLEFWDAHPDASRKRVRCGVERVYVCDTRVAFVDFIDQLCRNGDISPALADRATL
jgi:hypothetical protein